MWWLLVPIWLGCSLLALALGRAAARGDARMEEAHQESGTEAPERPAERMDSFASAACPSKD